MLEIRSSGRVPAGPLTTASAIAVGMALVWALVALWSSQAFTRRPFAYYETVIVTPEGTPLISRVNTGILERTEFFTLDRKPYPAHELTQIAGRKAKLKFTTNPDLIAGVVAHVGSKVYDGSVRGQLDRLRAGLGRE